MQQRSVAVLLIDLVSLEYEKKVFFNASKCPYLQIVAFTKYENKEILRQTKIQGVFPISLNSNYKNSLSSILSQVLEQIYADKYGLVKNTASFTNT